MEMLTVKHLSFRYPGSDRDAVKDVSFSVGRGEFVVLCGATGSGKSTLLRLLKRELAPRGSCSGEIEIAGIAQQQLDPRRAARDVGFVLQQPEQQLVTDKVWHELAFGPENMGEPHDVIGRRVAEMASYFGIEAWFDRSVDTLSGGQKQLLNLASVMTMQPRILLLDEPTAQLDPIAASNFIHTLQKLNRELSLTVVIAEHRLEELVPLCDRLLIMEQGALIASEPPRATAARLSERSPLWCAMPAALRVFRALEQQPNDCAPLTEREGRTYIEEGYDNRTRALSREQPEARPEAVLSLDRIFFRYERTAPDVLRGLSLSVREGESLCILGGNGTGKSTLLRVLAGLNTPYSGSVSVFGKNIRSYRGNTLYRDCVALLPQDVRTMFSCDTVAQELHGCDEVSDLLPHTLSRLGHRHPYDLSGGEQQLLALAKVLSQRPRLLLLDEPTKGLDAQAKLGILQIIRSLRDRGMTVVTVTHDVEFAALCADRCAMFFRGEITSIAPPHLFFAENSFYTTAAARMSRDHFDGAVTVDDVVALCRLNGRKAGGDT